MSDNFSQDLVMKQEAVIDVGEAREEDFSFVSDLMNEALSPYYDGDHTGHAKRIFQAHISGGRDPVGFFSTEQKMFIIKVDGKPAGMIHLVAKRQGTQKISPIIIAKEYRGRKGLGTALLEFAEKYVKTKGARQMYCTVSEQNKSALQFFIRKGYVATGRADSQYKPNIREVMMYKVFRDPGFDERFDKPNISVVPYQEDFEPQVRQLILETLPKNFEGVDERWVDALLAGYQRRETRDIFQKYKLIYVAIDRRNEVQGVIGATPKKGAPIRIMPFVTKNLPAFTALLIEIPYILNPHGRKLYLHLTPSVEETIALQRHGWTLDGVLPGAYSKKQVIQQWSITLPGEDYMRLTRVKQHYLDMIKTGRKTLEVRVGYPNIRTIQPGERIRFASHADSIIIRVKDVRQYPTIVEMLNVEDPNRIAPGLTKAQALKLLQRIYPSRLERLGVFVLEIQVEQSNPQLGKDYH